MAFINDLGPRFVKFCMRLSICAYRDDFENLNKNIIMKKNSIEKNKISKPVFYVLVSDDKRNMFVVTRGAASSADFQTILDMSETKTESGTFHSGFFKAAKYVYKKSSPLIKKFLEEDDEEEETTIANDTNNKNCSEIGNNNNTSLFNNNDNNSVNESNENSINLNDFNSKYDSYQDGNYNKVSCKNVDNNNNNISINANGGNNNKAEDGICFKTEWPIGSAEDLDDCVIGNNVHVHFARPKNVFFVGHSYGGAVSASLVLLFGRRDFRAVVFGAPPVVDLAHSNAYDDCIASFVAEHDLIPTLSVPNIAKRLREVIDLKDHIEIVDEKKEVDIEKKTIDNNVKIDEERKIEIVDKKKIDEDEIMIEMKEIKIKEKKIDIKEAMAIEINTFEEKKTLDENKIDGKEAMTIEKKTIDEKRMIDEFNNILDSFETEGVPAGKEVVASLKRAAPLFIDNVVQLIRDNLDKVVRYTPGCVYHITAKVGASAKLVDCKVNPTASLDILSAFKSAVADHPPATYESCIDRLIE